jgi:hypothetical protein
MRRIWEKVSIKRTVPIIIVLILISFMQQGQLNKLYAGTIKNKAEDISQYPATPEEVVEKEHRIQYEATFPGKQSYFLRDVKCEADYRITVKSFTVKKLIQSKNKAKVMVEFEVVGIFSGGYISEKKDNGNTLTKIKASECDDFDIFRTTGGKFDYGVIYYNLVKKDDKWKIVPKRACDVIYMSIDSTINSIENELRFIKDDSIKKRNLEIISSLKNLQKH